MFRYHSTVSLRLAVTAALLFTAVSCAGDAPPPHHPAKVIRTFPHDPDAFTQGLEFHGGELYESTGLVGHSGIRQVDLGSGRVLRQLTTLPPYFGEGITILNGKLYQLTWQHQTGFVYSFPALQLERRFTYTGEGWGLANDGKSLYLSDGTATIRVLDPTTFAVTRSISVTDSGRPVANLNELEWVNGEIYANVWMTDRIARISPETGAVVGWLDLEHLPRERGTSDVLNGIAYDPASRRLLVTGKLWRNVYEIELPPAR